MTPNIDSKPDIKVSIKQTFGIDSEMEVDGFSEKNEYVPEIDKNYKFDKDTTLAIISGFAFNNFETLPLKELRKPASSLSDILRLPCLATLLRNFVISATVLLLNKPNEA